MLFVVNDINVDCQSEIYYFPVLDKSNKIILLLSVINTSDGWTHSVSEEWVSGLNNLGQITSDFIFYNSEGNLYAEDKDNKYIIQGSEDVKIKFYSLRNYSDKKADVYKMVINFQEVDYNDCSKDLYNLKVGYTPSFSTSNSSSKVCKLYNQKNQGNSVLCWASSVATICNYRDGTNVTPIQVANAMGVGIFDGAGFSTCAKALKHFGVDYNVNRLNKANLMSWVDVKSNIKSKFPVYMWADSPSASMAHVVTVYGYITAAGVNYIVLWNSGENNGQGGSVTVAFKADGTTFGYANDTYVWMKSISKY